ncbi:hypothetical protein ACOSQ3_015875 [Xanthoceras sorbifolium]
MHVSLSRSLHQALFLIKFNGIKWRRMKEEREMAERCDEGGGSGTGGLCIAKVAMEGWRLSVMWRQRGGGGRETKRERWSYMEQSLIHISYGLIKQ